MNNKVKEHGQVKHTAQATIASGGVVELTNRIGVAEKAASSGQDVILEVEGIFEFDKVVGDNMALDAKVYWDADESEMTLDSGEKKAGLVAKAAGSGVSKVHVDINKWSPA